MAVVCQLMPTTRPSMKRCIIHVSLVFGRQSCMNKHKSLVLKKIKEVFPDADEQEMLLRFEALDNPEPYRVVLAILKLCEEDERDTPDAFIESARQDYRDVLMWAEYPNEMNLDSWKEPAEKVRETRKKDLKQYRDWLEKKGET